MLEDEISSMQISSLFFSGLLVDPKSEPKNILLSLASKSFLSSSLLSLMKSMQILMCFLDSFLKFLLCQECVSNDKNFSNLFMRTIIYQELSSIKINSLRGYYGK
jgi:hypothetical protein